FRDFTHAQRSWRLCELWNATFASHWGWTPLSPELAGLFVVDGQPVLDTSVFALSGGEPVGFCFVLPDDLSHAELAPGRALRAAARTQDRARARRAARRPPMRPQLREGRLRIPRARAPRLDPRPLPARARRHLALAPDGDRAGRRAARELPPLPPQLRAPLT